MPLTAGDIDASARQRLELWSGELDSEVSIGGSALMTRTVAHMDLDIFSWNFSSDLLAAHSGSNQLVLRVAFPYGSGASNGGGHDWSAHAHHTRGFA